jgi:hypothetical protein
MRKTNTKLTRFFALAVIALMHSNIATAQMTFQSSRHIEPAYEGWRQNDDGTFSLIFGYFNENWEEQPNIPIGENNQFSPGDIDRGQPTHFLPRRNRFTFEVVVPADWGDKDLVWTLSSPNGESRKAYASLQPDYVIDNVVIASETGSLGAGTSSPESRSNQPPRVEILGDSPRSVRVGEDLVVRARVTDDGLPRPTNLAALEVPQNAMARMMRPPSRPTVNKINGLFLSWNVYRAPTRPGSVRRKSNHGRIQERLRIPPGELYGRHRQFLQMAYMKSQSSLMRQALTCFGQERMTVDCTSTSTLP